VTAPDFACGYADDGCFKILGRSYVKVLFLGVGITLPRSRQA
jgi:hypothetical protein